MRTKEEREHLEREFARLDKAPNVTPLTQVESMRETEDQENARHIRQLESLVGGMQQSMANYQGQTSAEIEHLKENIVDLKHAMTEQTRLIRETYARVTNGLNDRVQKLESQAHPADEGAATEKDLNATANALRDQIGRMDRTYKWIIGLVTTVNVGAIGALSALVLL
jgi:hypothetical protein